MPEGDVVWHTARALHSALAGRPLTRSDFRVPRYATADLRGRSVLDTISRGKHLLTRIEGGLTIHTHLKMEGSWRVLRPGPPPRDHRVRLILANASHQAVGRSLGIVEVLKTARESEAVGHLGPDLLGADWDPAEAVRRLSAQPDRTIGEALLDQTRLAGIGTIYRAETLFLRGLHPRRTIGSIDDLTGLVELAHRLLDANKDRVGQVTTGVDRPGANVWVYGRVHRPCHRCGTLIRRGDLGAAPYDRVIYWCPRCQPSP
jgi:endonuclease-8